MPPRPTAVLAFLVVAAAPPARAQTAERDTLPPQTEAVDVRVLRAVYGATAPPVAVPLRAVNGAAYPVFVGAAPALAAGAWATGADLRPAVRLVAAEGGALALTWALKQAVRRPRPYVALGGVEARDRQFAGDDVFDPHSFPSGHATAAFAVATSLSLSYPEWYVAGPALTWAALAAVARVWHGVHYPSDVLVGSGVGAASAVVVHLLLPRADGGGAVAVVPFAVRVPL